MNETVRKLQKWGLIAEKSRCAGGGFSKKTAIQPAYPDCDEPMCRDDLVGPVLYRSVERIKYPFAEAVPPGVKNLAKLRPDDEELARSTTWVRCRQKISCPMLKRLIEMEKLQMATSRSEKVESDQRTQKSKHLQRATTYASFGNDGSPRARTPLHTLDDDIDDVDDDVSKRGLKFCPKCGEHHVVESCFLNVYEARCRTSLVEAAVHPTIRRLLLKSPFLQRLAGAKRTGDRKAIKRSVTSKNVMNIIPIWFI